MTNCENKNHRRSLLFGSARVSLPVRRDSPMKGKSPSSDWWTRSLVLRRRRCVRPKRRP